MLIDRFLGAMESMLQEPGDTDDVAIVFPGDMDPCDRHYRYGIHIDAELRMAGLGAAGGGGSLSKLGDDGDWETACSILDVALSDVGRGRALIREQLLLLDCPPGMLIQFGDREDRWDGTDWHLAEPRRFDEDELDAE